MKRFGIVGAALVGGLVTAEPALAASCDGAGAVPIGIGVVGPIEGGKPVSHRVELTAGAALLIELLRSDDADSESDEEGAAQPGATSDNLRICDAKGTLIAPLPSEVFAEGGSLVRSANGLRLRFVAPAAGTYLIAGAPMQEARELLLRRRAFTAPSRTVTELEMGGSDFAQVSTAEPLVYSFSGQAGQWVQITARSDNDTVLRLAAPGANGTYEVMAENDDSDGLNPVIRRRLPATGRYYFQVAAISGDEEEPVSVLVQPSEPPRAPDAPLALRPGVTVKGVLADSDERKVYALPVQANHSYQLELTAPYDAVLEVGVEDPMLAEDGQTGNAFSALRTRDATLTGSEKISFIARSNGRVLVQVRAFKVEVGEGYTLLATDGGL